MKTSPSPEHKFITEPQYLELCKACDQILRAQDSTAERVAISWLHVIREHPAFLPKYVAIFESRQNLQLFFQLKARPVINYGKFLFRLGKTLISRVPNFHVLNISSKPYDVVFVSHLLNRSHIGRLNDFYFGEVPNELAMRGLSVAIIFINHTEASARSIQDAWRGSSVTRIVLNKSLSFPAEFALHQRAAQESQRLTTLRKSLMPALLRRIVARSAAEALESSTLTNMRIASQIRTLIAHLRPKVVVSTHEGHAFERVAFAAARESMPEVCCVAHQHSALFRLQHSIRRNLSAPYNPDFILASGVISQSQLKNAPELRHIPIMVFGSTRILKPTGGIKQTPTASMFATHKSKNNCLVVPEYDWSECDTLFEFSLECALALPNINFVWRLHPLISFKSLLKRNRRLRARTPNIELSDRTLEEDIGRCQLALYRGTTAVVQAVMGGLTPIYLQMRGEMTIDPLYEIEKGKFIVRTPKEFAEMIGTPRDTINGATEQDRAELVDYCSRFYVPMDFQVLEKIIRDAPERAQANTAERNPEPPSPF